METQEIHPASTLARVRQELEAARQVVTPTAEEQEIIQAHQQLQAEHGQLAAQAQAGPIAALRHADALVSLERRLLILWPSYEQACLNMNRNRATIEALQAEERNYLTTVELAAANLARIDAEEQEALSSFAQRRAALQKEIDKVTGDPDTPAVAQDRNQQATEQRAEQARHTALWVLQQITTRGGNQEDERAAKHVIARLAQLPNTERKIAEIFDILRPICLLYQAA